MTRPHGGERRAARLPISIEALRLAIVAAAGLSIEACDLEALRAAATSGAGGAATTGTSASASATSSTAQSGGSGGAPLVTVSVSASTGGGGPIDPVCAGATAVPVEGGGDSGVAQCPDGTVHRDHATTCDPTISAPACTGTEMNVSCHADTDCTAGPHGRCVSTATVEDMGVLTACGCHYACVDDAECGDGQACICNGVVSLGDPWSQCAPAACRTGADCASHECGVSEYFDGCGMNVKLACRAATDACHTDADCFVAGQAHKTCVLFSSTPGEAPSWQCKPWTCVLGRPLVVDGVARVAAAGARSGWRADDEIAAIDAADADLSDDDRRAIAAHWIEAAALEHASIASFARFTLELLSLGAPAELVLDAQRAGIDEIEHARLAYAMASRHDGREIGPLELDVRGLAPRTCRREIARALVVEACVGETLGVVDARTVAAHAGDPALRALAVRIAEDEQRHAELAWRSLAWLLASSRDEDGVATAVRDAFAEALRDASVEPPARDGRLAAHGLVASADLARGRRVAVEEIVAPAAAALLAARG